MRLTVLAAIAVVVLAGCADSGNETPTEAPDGAAVETMTIRGVVLDPAINPLEGITVQVLDQNLSMVTGPGGEFLFTDLPIAIYTVQASAEGYTTAKVQWNQGGPLDPQGLIIEPLGATPTSITARYVGKLECAAEYLIISGSCDRYLEPLGQQVLAQESIFEHGLADGWATVVVDVSFDSGAEATYDGLRVSAKAPGDSDELSAYQKFGSFHGSESFTFRLEPLQEYDNGDRPAPDSNATSIIFDVFAQGHTHGTVCTPAAVYDECFLGVGAGLQIEFELIVTTFYVEPAPEGFSLL